jgi:hypothetical protein
MDILIAYELLITRNNLLIWKNMISNLFRVLKLISDQPYIDEKSWNEFLVGC